MISTLWPKSHSSFPPPESRLISYFSPVVPALQTDKRLQQACDFACNETWKEETCQQTTQAFKAVVYSQYYSVADCLLDLPLFSVSVRNYTVFPKNSPPFFSCEHVLNDLLHIMFIMLCITATGESELSVLSPGSLPFQENTCAVFLSGFWS